jgi:hypothetical protein
LTRAAWRLALVIVGSLATCLAGVGAQATPPDPRAAQPERPTVATHAFVVAPDVFELEGGIQWQHDRPDVDGAI